MSRAPFASRSLALATAVAAGLLAAPPASGAFGQTTSDAPARRADAVVDLATAEGLRLVKGEWRYADARVVEAENRAPGADLKPSGAVVRALDVAPRAGAADFDDSGWEVVAPGALDRRRGSGKLSFAWYRLSLTVPERVGRLETAGSTAVFEVVVDDYAEVWVNGQLPVALGQAGGPLIKGFNAPNRVVIGRGLTPGQKVEVAVFAANGPLSAPPGNFIWVRSATLDFYKSGDPEAKGVAAEVVRLDPAIDAVVPPGARIEKLAGGFAFTEGPVWSPAGFLLFSDPNENTIYRWSPDGQVSVYRTKSGYSGPDIGEYGQPGSNGLTFDPDGRLTICEHGNRRVVRIEKTGAVTVLADRFEGRRLNSPNDLVYRSDGALFFTDPPFGLPRFGEDPRKELPFSGVYALVSGTLRLLTAELAGPNGIALSPDERRLYVGNWDPRRKVVMRYDLAADGTVSNGVVFADLTAAPGDDAIDGVKVDRAGNVYVSGPGGLWVYSPAGKALGRVVGPEHPHNMAWGEDGRALFLAAQTGIYRLSLAAAGARP